MRAMQLAAFGGPEQLKLVELNRPEPKADEVLIKAHAIAINPVDCKTRQGYQQAIIPLRPPCVLGMDVSGSVVAVGSAVKRFKVGDEVISSPSHKRQGCYAELVAIPEAEVAYKPKNLTHEEAASLPLVGLTAWDSLVRVAPGGLAGQRVLIQAGAGGVGSIAVQLARHLGATVYATASGRNIALLEELGAHHPIDYTSQSWQEVAAGCDLIVDSLGGQALEDALKVVRPGGIVVSLMSGLPEAAKRHGPYLGFGAVLTRMVRLIVGARLSRQVRLKPVARQPDGLALQELVKLVEAGQIKPLVERVFPFEELPQAHELLEQGRTRGKLVLTL